MEQISSYLVYNIVSLGMMAGKGEPFSWTSVEDELEYQIWTLGWISRWISVKYLENLVV